MTYANAVYKTADSSSTLQMSNRAIVEHPEQMDRAIVEHPEQMVSNRAIVEHLEQMVEQNYCRTS